MKNLSDDHEDHPNQHENSHNLCDEKGCPLLSLNESQWKLRQHNQNLPVEGKKKYHCRTDTRVRQKTKNCDSHSQES